MARKTSRQAIEKRIRKSLRYLGEGDAEDAIYNIAPIIDVIAKDRYPGIKSVGERVKKYIFDEQTLIYYLSTQGKITLPDGVRIVMVDHHNTDKPVGGNGGELSDFIYHNIRCAQSHDGEIDYEFVDIGRQFGIGRQTFEGDGAPLTPGKFVVSNATVLAIILSVICAPENGRIKLDGDISLYGKIVLARDQLVGNRAYLMEKLKHLFGENS